MANIFWYPINFQRKNILELTSIQIDFKIHIFKFYAIRIFDYQCNLFRFSIQSSTSFELSNTERRSGEFGARNLTDAVRTAVWIESGLWLHTQQRIESEACAGFFFLFQKNLRVNNLQSIKRHSFFNKMEQNLSLYEDALQFYLVISTDNGELSESMQFAREVCVFW